METQHRDWLRALASAGKGGVTLPQIDRGLSYPLTLKIPLDVTGDSFTAALRPAPDAGSLAEFTVSVGSWDGTYTPVTFTLSKSQVDALPADGDANGLEEMVMDVLRTPEGDAQYRFLGGNVFISGKVAADA
ncbi:MAG: hypothetical protein CL950_13275 [Erythrobacter sp.]|nr:hypothetical protein [Erythrobacter sp.]|tara:strand:+ start:14118 stop:14513 length:396 start_codon:yes stop_codon:yes gene_type:complete